MSKEKKLGKTAKKRIYGTGIAFADIVESDLEPCDVANWKQSVEEND